MCHITNTAGFFGARSILYLSLALNFVQHVTLYMLQTSDLKTSREAPPKGGTAKELRAHQLPSTV